MQRVRSVKYAASRLAYAALGLAVALIAAPVWVRLAEEYMEFQQWRKGW